MNPAQEIEVEAQTGGDYLLTWRSSYSSGPVDIYTGATPAQIDTSDVIVSGARHRAVVSGLSEGVPHYFMLQPQEGGAAAVVGARQIPLEGAVNFRDLGGYPASGKRLTQWGRLYRSGHLSNLTAAGLEHFAALGVTAACDFRMSVERASEAMALPPETQVESLEIPPGVGDRFYFHRLFRESDDPQDIADAIAAVVRSMVNESAIRYKKLFEILLNESHRTVLLNCSAGKERTGVGTALVLSALGVSREDIYFDYMLSAKYFPIESEIPRTVQKYEVDGDAARQRRMVMPFLETRREYLHTAFDFIDEEHGGTLEFLRNVYNLGAQELSELQEKFTEPARG